MKKGVLVVLIALALVGCAELRGEVDDPLQPGRVLFDSYRVDTEWGYKLDGIYIDSDGLVWYYSHDEPWYPAEQRATVVTEKDLLTKYDGAERVGSIDPRVLKEMADLIPGASRGRVSRDTPLLERNGNLDAAYVFILRTGNYKLVFLRGGGAWAARNFSPEAKRLLEWLGEVKTTVGFD